MNKRTSKNDPGAMMPPGEVRPIAEIEIGPTKHEKFLDQNYKKIALAVLAVALLVGGYIVHQVTSEEKVRDSGAALVAAMHDGTGADAAAFEKVKAEYSGTNAAVTAAYLNALSLWEQGKADEGNAAMEAFIANAPTDMWKAQASVVLGCRYMKDGKNEEAQQHFTAALACGDTPYAPLALLSLGDIAYAGKDAEKAKTYYNELKERYPSSMFALASEEAPGVTGREALLGISAPEKVRPSATPSVPLTPPATEAPSLPSFGGGLIQGE